MFSHFEIDNEVSYDKFINVYLSDGGGVSIVIDSRTRAGIFNLFGNNYYVTANEKFSELIISNSSNFYIIGCKVVDSISYKTRKYWKDHIKYTRKHKLPAWF